MADESELIQTVKSLPKELQPRERMLRYGPKALSDEEIVAILLKTGVHGCNVLELSRRFCAALKYGLPQLSGRVSVRMKEEDGSVYEPPAGEGPYGVDEYTHLKLTSASLKYLNSTHIRTLRVAQELGRRIYLPDENSRPTPILRASQAADAFAVLMDEAAERTPGVQTWWVMFVDGRRVPIGQVQQLEDVPTGSGGRTVTFDEIQAFTRALLRWAVILSARGMFVAHRNPGGGVSHTQNDVKLTEALIEAAHAVGIAVHDHLVVDRRGVTPGYASFRAGDVCGF